MQYLAPRLQTSKIIAIHLSLLNLIERAFFTASILCKSSVPWLRHTAMNAQP
jgi:hypothetical protein